MLRTTQPTVKRVVTFSALMKERIAVCLEVIFQTEEGLLSESVEEHAVHGCSAGP